MSKEERLQKILAQRGLASRRGAEQLIAAGRVRVNGQVAQIGDKADPARDAIALDGAPVEQEPSRLYLMLYKPRGVVTTMHDEKNRRCVAELVREVPGRVYPVGRLDRESEGLLLMTNDGAFANAMMHPSAHVPKLYRVTVRPSITEEQLVQMSVGMVLDGRRTAPSQVRVLSQEPGRVVLEIALHEGRNRQIRKMCEQLGLEVARLKRVAIGPLKLGMLQPGAYRMLTEAELKALKNAGKADKLSSQRSGKNHADHSSRAQRTRNSSHSARRSHHS